MKYKEAKKIVDDFYREHNIIIRFDWTWWLTGRRLIKKWAKEALEGEQDYNSEV